MFKFKSDKTKPVKEECTLDETHREFVKSFETAGNSIDTLKMRLTTAISELHKFESGIRPIISDDDIKEKSILKDEIEKLKHDIDDVTHNKSEIEYYDKIGDVIIKYYDMLDNPNTVYSDDEQPNMQDFQNMVHNRKRSKIVPPSQQHILCFFSNNSTHESDTQPINEKPKHLSTLSDSVREIHSSLPKNRAILREQYMVAMNKNDVILTKRKQNNVKFCENCKIERTLVQSDGVYVCSVCGETETAMVESDIPNYKDSVNDKQNYPYKRQNHLVEWLNQFQARESIEIPKDVLDSIILELKRSRITDISKINIVDMKAILKKLKLHQYYEHMPFIISRVSGKPPPTLDRETEEEIKQMFKEIQEPFEKYRPTDRTNFLSYSYLLHKFFQILGMSEFVPYFPLLKSHDKLRAQDKLWKQICEELEWQYYPSI